MRKLLRSLRQKIIRRQENWAIGIYTGSSPLALYPSTDTDRPVLTAQNVTDVKADFVADPFMIHHEGNWYMFFEILVSRKNKGVIGLATSSDGLSWRYNKVILDELFHLSYPYVFKWKDHFYMIPETARANSIRLYRANKFPEKWTFHKTLLENDRYVDSSIIYFENLWWLFTSNPKNDRLSIYYAEDLMGSWIEHPQNPIIKGNDRIARPGGRVIECDDRLIRYTQDDRIIYGNQVWAYEITKLTTELYQEQPAEQSPILKAARAGWNEVGMHNIDPHFTKDKRWLACVDGYQVNFILGNKYKYPSKHLNYLLNVINQ
jgi:hypothetical protein